MGILWPPVDRGTVTGSSLARQGLLCSTSAPALGCIYSLMGNGSLGMQGTGRAGLRDEAKTGRLSRRLTLYTTHSAGLSSSFFPSGDGGYICRDTGIVEVCASPGSGRRGPC